jgi:membrane-associated protease RseP (regulator of RpoE activity)
MAAAARYVLKNLSPIGPTVPEEMSSPKHLWSGDWESEAAAAARERARRGVPVGAPEPAPAPKPEPAEPRPAIERRPLPRPRLTPILLVALAALVLAGGAYGVIALTGSSHPGAAAATRPTAWLGVNMETLPINRVMIAAVVPGSPADRAGLGPGDVITMINSRRVAAPGDVTAAISSLRPGDTVKIQVQRGPATYTTQATLQAQPANFP